MQEIKDQTEELRDALEKAKEKNPRLAEENRFLEDELTKARGLRLTDRRQRRMRAWNFIMTTNIKDTTRAFDYRS